MGLLDDAIREHLELKRRHGADSAEISRQEREILGGGPAVPEVSEPEEAVDADAAAAGLDDAPLAAEPAGDEEVVDDALFPHTDELIEAGASPVVREEPVATPAPAAASIPVTPAPAAPAPAVPGATPAPSDADPEVAAKSGARKLSDEELAAWRKRLSERADRLAAQRAGTAEPSTPAAPAASTPSEEQPPPVWSARKPEPPAEPKGGVPTDFFDAGEAERAFEPEPVPEPEPDHDVLDETPEFLQETPEHDRMWFEQRPPRDFDFGG